MYIIDQLDWPEIHIFQDILLQQIFFLSFLLKVKPKDRFMKLLKSVGAEGPRFTAQEVRCDTLKDRYID